MKDADRLKKQLFKSMAVQNRTFVKVGVNRFLGTNTRLQTALIERTPTGTSRDRISNIHRKGINFLSGVFPTIKKDKDGLSKKSMVIRDMYTNKKLEDELKKTNTLLKLFVQKTTRKTYLDAVSELLQKWIDCQCIGIRILNKDGYIPYESYFGFSKEFWESENWLSIQDNQCACIRVIIEKPEPQDAICTTNGGSFCCNNSIKFVGEMEAEEQARFRGKCVDLGYHSIAIIPLRYHDRVLGAIHIADEKEGKIPLETIEFIEKVSPLIGEAIYRFDLEDELRLQKNILENLVEERTNELRHAYEKLKNDNIEQKRLGEQLRKSNQKVTDILESITDAFFTLDDQWKLMYLNKAAQTYFAKSEQECIGNNLWDVFPCLIGSLFHNNCLKVMTEKNACHFEFKFNGIDYEKWIEIHAYPFQDGISVYFRDITELRKCQKDIMRLDRLNLVGEMAAGIAHEIRNPMTTVRGFLQILGKKERYSSDMEFLNLMVEELDRANSIITEFLSLAKNKAVEFKTKNLNEIVKVLYPLITADAALNDKYLKLELSEIPNLLLDEKEIRQLILNLTRNGLEAMSRGCCLVIKTYVDNNEVVLAVIDQGRGIDLQLIDKISTPFFTTKDNGVGLGLATCYSIANRHNAKINFDTGADGTIFYVRFKVTKVTSQGFQLGGIG